MTGTFGGALEARKIRADAGRLTSDVVGEVEKDGRVLVIRRIHVTYHLAVEPDADRAAIQRAYEVHPPNCPVYRSLHPQIQITTDLDLRDQPAPARPD